MVGTKDKTNHNCFTIPNTNIQTLNSFDKLDFFDKQSVHLSKQITPLEAWGAIVAQPMPILKLAFWLRDRISSLFGVEKVSGFAGTVPQTAQVGDKLDFFLIEYISKDVLTLTARDVHLDVMTCISIKDNVLSITSSVETHNMFGRIYMIPVAPIHKMIVHNNLSNLQKSLA